MITPLSTMMNNPVMNSSRRNHHETSSESKQPEEEKKLLLIDYSQHKAEVSADDLSSSLKIQTTNASSVASTKKSIRRSISCPMGGDPYDNDRGDDTSISGCSFHSSSLLSLAELEAEGSESPTNPTPQHDEEVSPNETEAAGGTSKQRRSSINFSIRRSTSTRSFFTPNSIDCQSITRLQKSISRRNLLTRRSSVILNNCLSSSQHNTNELSPAHPYPATPKLRRDSRSSNSLKASVEALAALEESSAHGRRIPSKRISSTSLNLNLPGMITMRRHNSLPPLDISYTNTSTSNHGGGRGPLGLRRSSTTGGYVGTTGSRRASTSMIGNKAAASAGLQQYLEEKKMNQKDEDKTSSSSLNNKSNSSLNKSNSSLNRSSNHSFSSHHSQGSSCTLRLRNSLANSNKALIESSKQKSKNSDSDTTTEGIGDILGIEIVAVAAAKPSPSSIRIDSNKMIALRKSQSFDQQKSNPLVPGGSPTKQQLKNAEWTSQASKSLSRTRSLLQRQSSNNNFSSTQKQPTTKEGNSPPSTRFTGIPVPNKPDRRGQLHRQRSLGSLGNRPSSLGYLGNRPSSSSLMDLDDSEMNNNSPTAGKPLNRRGSDTMINFRKTMSSRNLFGGGRGGGGRGGKAPHRSISMDESNASVVSTGFRRSTMMIRHGSVRGLGLNKTSNHSTTSTKRSNGSATGPTSLDESTTSISSHFSTESLSLSRASNRPSMSRQGSSRCMPIRQSSSRQLLGTSELYLSSLQRATSGGGGETKKNAEWMSTKIGLTTNSRGTKSLLPGKSDALKLSRGSSLGSSTAAVATPTPFVSKLQQLQWGHRSLGYLPTMDESERSSMSRSTKSSNHASRRGSTSMMVGTSSSSPTLSNLFDGTRTTGLHKSTSRSDDDDDDDDDCGSDDDKSNDDDATATSTPSRITTSSRRSSATSNSSTRKREEDSTSVNSSSTNKKSCNASKDDDEPSTSTSTTTTSKPTTPNFGRQSLGAYLSDGRRRTAAGKKDKSSKQKKNATSLKSSLQSNSCDPTMDESNSSVESEASKRSLHSQTSLSISNIRRPRRSASGTGGSRRSSKCGLSDPTLDRRRSGSRGRRGHGGSLDLMPGLVGLMGSVSTMGSDPTMDVSNVSTESEYSAAGHGSGSSLGRSNTSSGRVRRRGSISGSTIRHVDSNQGLSLGLSTSEAYLCQQQRRPSATGSCSSGGASAATGRNAEWTSNRRHSTMGSCNLTSTTTTPSHNSYNGDTNTNDTNKAQQLSTLNSLLPGKLQVNLDPSKSTGARTRIAATRSKSAAGSMFSHGLLGRGAYMSDESEASARLLSPR